MAISKDITIKILGNQSRLDENIYVYEKDNGVIFNFKLIQYKYKYDKDPDNILNSNATDILEAYTTIVNPLGEELQQLNGEVVNDIVKFTLDKTYTDQLTEIGIYNLQIHIKCTHAEFSIPPITFEVLERLKGKSTPGNSQADSAQVDITTIQNDVAQIDVVDGILNVVWQRGDIISSTKLNQMTEAINNNTRTNKSQNDRIASVENELTGIPTKTSQLQNDSDFATNASVDAKIASAVTGGQVDLSSYAKKTDIPTRTSQLTNDSNFISSIPSEYITESELNAKGYLTEHQSLEDYALKTELPSVPTKVSQLTNDSGFINSIPSEYVTESELNAKGYLTEHQDISGKADKSYVDTELAKKSNTNHTHDQYLTQHQDLSNYALKTEIPTVPTKTSQLTNDSGFINNATTELNISSIVLGNYQIKYNSADDTLDFIFNGVIDNPDVPPTTEEVVPLTWALGNLNSSGAETVQDSTLRSGFVAIEDNCHYSFYLDTSMEDPRGIRVYFYDTNKTFISRTDGDVLLYTTGTDIVIDIPSNAAYMRFKSNVNGTTTINNINSLFTLRKRKIYITNGLSMYIDAQDVTTQNSIRDITGKQSIVNHGVSTTLDNGCLNFVSSESDYIDGGFKPNLTKWSAEVYFYFTATPTEAETVLGWGASGNRTAIAIWGNNFMIAINGNVEHTITSTVPTSLTHVILTYDNGKIIAYINGAKSQITTSAEVMTSQAGNLMIGTKYSASGEFGNIHLKSLRFYDGKVLTDEEASQNYNYEINRNDGIIKPTWIYNKKLDTNTGLEAGADKNACTEFIAYDNSYNYTLAIDGVEFFRVYYYDSSQSYIRNDSIANNFNGVITPPENTAYIRLKLNRGTVEFADLDNHVIFRKTHK